MTPEKRKKASNLHDQLGQAQILPKEASHMLMRYALSDTSISFKHVKQLDDLWRKS